MQYIITEQAKELGLYEKGLLPATSGSAGIDLYVADTKPVFVTPNVPATIHTGLHLWADIDSVVTILVPRSSSQFRLVNTVGVIDSDYQGEIIAKVISNTDQSFFLEPGDKFAQILLSHILVPRLQRFEQVEEFSDKTERGHGAFGSTGK